MNTALDGLEIALDKLIAEKRKLEAVNKDLLAALGNFASMYTCSQGNSYANAARDNFFSLCPEFYSYCDRARSAIRKAKGAT